MKRQEIAESLLRPKFLLYNLLGYVAPPPNEDSKGRIARRVAMNRLIKEHERKTGALDLEI